MARGKVVTKSYKTVKVPTKTGGFKNKTVLDKKTVTKATNQAKGAGVQRTFTTDKAKLASQRIQAKENIAKAKVLGRNTDIAAITSGIASTVSSGFGRIQPGNTEQRDLSRIGTGNSAVEQAVNGGVTQAGNTRNDDEDDESPYID